MSLLPPDHLMTDDDLLENLEGTYARTAAYVKIYEGRRDLALASGVSANHVQEHEDDLRVYRRALAQYWRSIQLLRLATGEYQTIPTGADETSSALVEPDFVPEPEGPDIAGLLGLGDL